MKLFINFLSFLIISLAQCAHASNNEYSAYIKDIKNQLNPDTYTYCAKKEVAFNPEIFTEGNGPEALFMTGMYYFMMGEKPPKYLKVFEKAAEGGSNSTGDDNKTCDNYACLVLGIFYKEGAFGIEKNPEKSENYFIKITHIKNSTFERENFLKLIHDFHKHLFHSNEYKKNINQSFLSEFDTLFTLKEKNEEEIIKINVIEEKKNEIKKDFDVGKKEKSLINAIFGKKNKKETNNKEDKKLQSFLNDTHNQSKRRQSIIGAFLKNNKKKEDKENNNKNLISQTPLTKFNSFGKIDDKK